MVARRRREMQTENASDPMRPRATDRPFTFSAEEGDPDCLCSRCGKPIPENVVAIRMWPEHQKWELRYHPTCLGMNSDEDDLADFLEEHGQWPPRE